MTHIGMRRISLLLQQWYPSAYDQSIFYASNTPNYIALTIDDGLFRQLAHDQESAPMIDEVRDLLRSYQARATFFVCTNYTMNEQAQLVLAEGHELGNHMREDRSGYYCRMNEDEFAREIDETNTILQSMINQSSKQTKIRWFRAPQGIMSRAMNTVLADRGMTNIMGDCYCDDWAFAEKVQSTTNVVAPLMMKQVQGGSIAIFHMPQRGFRESTLDAIREFLDGMKERNLKVVTVSDLLRHEEDKKNT
jgi:peptidoglycan/xylan/chitin deacetylase (PgdA/CDA1 family)